MMTFAEFAKSWLARRQFQTHGESIAAAEHVTAFAGDLATMTLGPDDLAAFEGHTPGPWRVWDDRQHSILEVCETVQTRERHPHFASVSHGDWWPEGYANARLMAAAPQLLAEVIRLCAILAQHEPDRAR
jgi:hypothetical protein